MDQQIQLLPDGTSTGVSTILTGQEPQSEITISYLGVWDIDVNIFIERYTNVRVLVLTMDGTNIVGSAEGNQLIPALADIMIKDVQNSEIIDLSSGRMVLKPISAENTLNPRDINIVCQRHSS